MIDRYRNYRAYAPEQPIRKKSHKGWLFFCVLACALLFFFTRKKPEAPSQPKAQAAKVKKVIAEPISSNTWNQLNTDVTAIINAHPELDISVAVIDVANNTKANYGIQDNFAGASTTKVLTAVTYLHQVEKGKESLNATIDGHSAKWHLSQMINQSNNESWLALNNEITYPVIQAYARSIGLSSYNYTTNVITASDEALLLQKLYANELLNESNRQLLLSYMQDTNDEDMIPAVIPEGSTVYHKYGQLEDRLHDAAIVEYKNRPLVLVIYTKGEDNANGTEYKNRVKIIQQLAQVTFSAIYTTQ